MAKAPVELGDDGESPSLGRALSARGSWSWRERVHAVILGKR